MKIHQALSSEVIGLVFVLISAAFTILLPGVADFWLALATAITLFLVMFVRSYLRLDAAVEQKSPPQIR